MKRLVAVMRAEPELSYAVIELLAEEAANLWGAGPGRYLLNFID